MQYIVYLAPLGILLLYWRAGCQQTLIRGYLPILLLLPDCYRALTPGLPDPSFNQAAILPLLLIALWRERAAWTPSISDVLVLAFASCVAYSEFSNAGYNEAQNLMFAMLASVVAPYLCARWLLREPGDDVACARVFVICCVLVSVISVYQFRFGINPWHLLIGPFFPGQGDGWVTTFRHGMARIAGPYSHAILAGVMLAMAWRLARWLQWGGHWEREMRHIRLPGSKAMWINGFLLVGIFMTVARGPWLGGVAGGALMWASHGRERHKRLWGVLFLFALAAFVGQFAMDAYLDIRPGMVMTTSQESAMYRKELMDQYRSIALEHAWFGWGRNTWPKMGGMVSIDNYYLLLALMHGVFSMVLLVFLLGWMAVRLLYHGLAEPSGQASLPFTFAGIIAMMFVSLGTVYLGEQPMPALFFVLGWAENLLHRRSHLLQVSVPSQAICGIGFRHVMR